MSITSNTNPNVIMVSGPVNVVRLEGNIHGINKVIYVFMDYHMGVKEQTQCANIFSEDIQKYFANSFRKLINANKQIYDFFLEIYPSELASTKQQKTGALAEPKEQYIEEVVKFFRKIFKYDPKQNKVSINELFKNLRLHYLDIRDYYKHNIYQQTKEMKNIAQEFMSTNNIQPNKLDRIIYLLQVMKHHIELVINILSADETANKTSSPKIIKHRSRNVDITALEYLANKIKSLYKYDDIKVIMNKLLDKNLANFNSVIKNIDNTIKRFDQYADIIIKNDPSSHTIRKMIRDIVNTVETIVYDQFVEYFARFTDIYFLRRFLDKDYITNAITYTGARHSNTYIDTLVKSFGFKITHAAYSKIADMDKLTNKIKKTSLTEIQELMLPPDIQQCSDMTNFPANFI